MRERLAILHYTNNTSLRVQNEFSQATSERSGTYLSLVFPLFIHAVFRLLTFVCCLDPAGYGTDLYPSKWACEVVIESERVVVADISRRWMLLQDLVLGARKRLKVSLQLDIGYRRC